MRFFAGYFTGIITVFILYLILREIIFKYGIPIRRIVENELGRMTDSTVNGATIIYEDLSKQIFDKEDTNLSDHLQ